MSDAESKTLEERLETLDALLEKMEVPGVTLDESFALYKAGLDEVKACSDMLDSMEKAMLMMNADGELEEF